MVCNKAMEYILFAGLLVCSYVLIVPCDEDTEKRSDDLSPLTSLVQQQAQTIQMLQAKLTAVESRLASVETGLQNEVNHKQAAFSVHFNSQNQDTVDLGSGGTIKFDSVTTNLGNNFNLEQGVFTAPVAGTYLFLLGVMIPTGKPYTECAIVTTGRRVLAVTHGGQNMIRDQAHVVIHLKTGDQVWAQQIYGGTIIQKYWWTVFSGILVQSD